ncbi:unnamed protein product [Dracunculus medinensis]|uniref:SCP domain-containing protein n=1 Tax=Dracunculus medinensis TaxID=318479 RepID=A0A0N4URP7_DRAME|nr:unnamed protein product [Dracunculus medinensis]
MGFIFVTAAILYLVYMGSLPVPNCNSSSNEDTGERGVRFAQERKRQLSMNADISEDSLMKWNCELEKTAALFIKKCRIAKIPRTSRTLVGNVYYHLFKESRIPATTANSQNSSNMVLPIFGKIFYPALYATIYHEEIELSNEEWQYAAEVGCSQIFCRIADGDNKGMLVKLAACFYKLRLVFSLSLVRSEQN